MSKPSQIISDVVTWLFTFAVCAVASAFLFFAGHWIFAIIGVLVGLVVPFEFIRWGREERERQEQLEATWNRHFEEQGLPPYEAKRKTR